MIGALLLVVVAVAGGAVATYLFDRDSPAYARPATGAFIGLTLLSFSAFGLSWVLGMGLTSLALAAAVTALPLLALRSPNVRAAVRRDLETTREQLTGALRKPTPGTVIKGLYGLVLVFGVWLVADRTFFQTSSGLFIGNVNNLGDLPYHVSITASFAYGNNFPPQNPVFAGSGFSYHYIADFLAAAFVGAGASLLEGMLVLTIALGLSLLVLIHRWALELTRSTVAARLSPLLLVFSGGLGWLDLFGTARTNQDGLLAAFTDSDARYTIGFEGILRFGNSVTTLLIPQRGLLLGMGLAVIVFTLLWRQLDEGRSAPDRPTDPRGWLRGIRAEPRMLVAGILTGVLPIVHVHTFAVVLGTAFFLGLVFRQWREGRWGAWAVYVLTALLVALPVFGLTARGSQANVSAFFGFELGWDHGTHDPFTFWLVNTGLLIPLLIAAFVWRGDKPLLPRKLLLYALPFLVWFVVPNVFRLAPWLWDNIKVLIYWWLGAVPLVALLLARLWQERGGAKLAAVGLAVVLMAAGFLDIARATVGPSYGEFDPDGIAFAEQIREQTPPNAVVLTAPVFNSPVFLTGRPVFMGYVGFLWANGLPYLEREPDVKTIYAGGPRSGGAAAAAWYLVRRRRAAGAPRGSRRTRRSWPASPSSSRPASTACTRRPPAAEGRGAGGAGGRASTAPQSEEY